MASFVTIASTCDNPILADGLLSFRPNQIKYQNGTELIFSCPPEYVLHGDLTTVCVNGQWETVNYPACTRCNASTQCLYPQVLDAMISCLGTGSGSIDPPCYGTWTHFYNCICGDMSKTNYRLSSTGRTYYCYPDGKWDPEFYELKCLGINALAKNSAGQINSVILDGDYVSYSCPVNFTAIGTSQVGCHDGAWADYQPFGCLAPCEVSAGLNVTAKNFEGHIASVILHGEYVTYSCPENFTAIGNSHVACNNGTWEYQQLFDCIETLPTMSSLTLPNNESTTFLEMASAFTTALGSKITSEARSSPSETKFSTGIYISTVEDAGCNSSTQCLYPQVLDAMISCQWVAARSTDPPCFGTWTYFYDCICNDTSKTNYRLSSTGRTYYCYPDGKWDPELYELKCLGKHYCHLLVSMVMLQSKTLK
ncbi:Complement factor H [Holothuria leucospilota]|uniref:Complement factor H n=1 Tax=Holothuria leucospilota TaxID=206669 RepID=A0A9Q1BG99_HOLLE|nr:Complement factor H [Holothuria leucospilota]